MSFKCNKCGVAQPAGQPSNTVVTEKRQKTYEVLVEKGQPQQAQGWEIKVESRVCPTCFEELTGEAPRKYNPEPVDSRKTTQLQSIREDIPRPKTEFWTSSRLNKDKFGPRGSNIPKNKEPRKPIVVEVIAPLKKVN
jgi:hypothetical protein